jgi:hypothetical protein
MEIENEKNIIKIDNKKTFSMQFEVSKTTFLLLSQTTNSSSEGTTTVIMGDQQLSMPATSESETLITIKPLKNE